jgi:2'-5' RNA ligase
MSQPLILSLRCDAATEKLLTSLRTKYFPSHRNFLAAHITLFHALPATSHELASDILARISSRESPFTIGVKSPFPLGKKGVGVHIASFKLCKLHEELLDLLTKEGVQLTNQDRQKLRPHVTVQNKVSPEEAQKTLMKIKEEFKESAGKAEAFSLWRYEEGGQWTHLQEFAFSGRLHT